MVLLLILFFFYCLTFVFYLFQPSHLTPSIHFLMDLSNTEQLPVVVQLMERIGGKLPQNLLDSAKVKLKSFSLNLCLIFSYLTFFSCRVFQWSRKRKPKPINCSAKISKCLVGAGMKVNAPIDMFLFLN